MKKPLKLVEKRLVLVRNQIRTLTNNELGQIAGGNTHPTIVCAPTESIVQK